MRIRIDRALSTSEIAARYGVSRITAWRARKCGWCCPDYHIRTVVAAPIDPAFVLDVAAHAFRCIFFHGLDVRHLVGKEDAIQEASARLLEMAGHQDIRYRPFALKIACRAILGAYRSARRVVGT